MSRVGDVFGVRDIVSSSFFFGESLSSSWYFLDFEWTGEGWEWEWVGVVRMVWYGMAWVVFRLVNLFQQNFFFFLCHCLSTSCIVSHAFNCHLFYLDLFFCFGCFCFSLYVSSGFYTFKAGRNFKISISFFCFFCFVSEIFRAVRVFVVFQAITARHRFPMYLPRITAAGLLNRILLSFIVLQFFFFRFSRVYPR